MRDWISYFDSDHPIYVNARHRDVHARLVAQGMLAYMPSGGRVLDYGCGEALHADTVAAKAGNLILCDAAPHVSANLSKRFAGSGKVNVMSPGEIAALPDACLDVIVLHSVAQYLTPDQADKLFSLFRRLLKPNGVFVLGDIVQPDVGAATDALALLKLGATNGFFFSAVMGLIRTMLSGYWQLRQSAGLTRYSESAMIEKLKQAGLSAQRAPHNIGHNQARMTFVAQRAG
jgi:SAM-dependent methyltransferase